MRVTDLQVTSDAKPGQAAAQHAAPVRGVGRESSCIRRRAREIPPLCSEWRFTQTL